MAYSSLRYLTVLNTNMVLLKAHTWTGSFTTASGMGTGMLDDDDATSLMKATGSLTTPTLEITFTDAQIPTAFGICNHNLYSAGWNGIYLEYHNGTTWVNVDTPGSDFYLVSGDHDFAVVFNPSTGARTRWRMRSDVTPTAFYIGYIYWGTYYQFSRNPSEFIQTRTPQIRYQTSAGGMQHATKGMAYRPGTLEMNFIRARRADVREMNTHGDNNIMAIIPPEATPDPLIAPYANHVFYGRVEDISVAPQTPSNITLANEVYDMTVNMRGAV